MSLSDFDIRIKEYEKQNTHYLDITKPIIIRLDGKNFSKYTKQFDKPFSEVLAHNFAQTMNSLVEFTGCKLGYTQSDEITLVSLPNTGNMFGANMNKINSICASFCTAKFNNYFSNLALKEAYFDCRCFNVPDLDEATNAVYSRIKSNYRNSVSMLAQFHFSHRELQNKSTEEMLEMLNSINVNYEGIRRVFRCGTLVKRIKRLRKFTETELDKLPEKHEARKNPNLKYERQDIRRFWLVTNSDHTKRKEQFFND